MKKMIWATPIFIVFSLLLVFCTQSSVVETMQPKATDQSVHDRADCKLEFWTDSENSLEVCGIGTNALTCNSCDPQVSYVGSEIVSGGGGAFNVTPPFKFSVTNIAATATNVRIVSANAVGWITLQPGDCQEFFLDDNCEIQ